jgi:PLP dependent protein
MPKRMAQGKVHRLPAAGSYRGTEETKSGFSIGGSQRQTGGMYPDSLKAARICGLMGMATFTDDREKVRSEFRSLADLFSRMRKQYFTGKSHFREISMGMSGDWRLAVGRGVP